MFPNGSSIRTRPSAGIRLIFVSILFTLEYEVHNMDSILVQTFQRLSSRKFCFKIFVGMICQRCVHFLQLQGMVGSQPGVILTVLKCPHSFTSFHSSHNLVVIMFVSEAQSLCQRDHIAQTQIKRYSFRLRSVFKICLVLAFWSPKRCFVLNSVSFSVYYRHCDTVEQVRPFV